MAEYTESSKVVKIYPYNLVLAITGATIGKTVINMSGKYITISGDLLGIRSNVLC
ncbi:MAG: hypothetical protein KJO12_06635 [Ignavibacteria bacterium]|nr:hypothetical protein [Ignavibacteria bacterium]